MRKCTAMAMMIILLLSSIQQAFGAVQKTVPAASHANDLAGHWAEREISEWINNGLVNGFPDGSFRPDQKITRGELAALVNRAFGFNETEPVSFTDLPETHWAYPDMTIAAKSGYLQGYGAGVIGAGRTVSRQEAAIVITRLLHGDPGTQGDAAEGFVDADQIAPWSKSAVEAAVSGNLMEGYPDGSFKPQSVITRAEMIIVLDRVMAEGNLSYNKAGTYGPSEGTKIVKGNVVVNAPGVTLRNMVINGNVLVAEGVGEGDAFMDHVTVKGTAAINGGGLNSVHLKDAVLNRVRIGKTSGGVRIVLEGGTTVNELDVAEGAGAGTTIVIGSDSSIGTLFLNEVIRVLGLGQINKAVYGIKGKGTTFERKPDQEEEGKLPAGGGSPLQNPVSPSNPDPSPGTDPSTGNPDPSPGTDPSTGNPDPSPGTDPSTGNPDPSPGTDPSTGNPDPGTDPSTESPEQPQQTAPLIKDGLPNADILISPQASDMEQLAAEELQSALKMVSGAELPIYKGQIEADSVSAQLWNNKLDISKVGTYPIRISMVNNRMVPVHIHLTQSDSGPIAVDIPYETILAAKESKTIEGTITITDSAGEGTHIVSLLASLEDLPVSTLTLTVNLNRNLIQNGGFETAAAGGNIPEGWIVPSGALDNQVAHTGTGSLRIDLGQYSYINATTNQKLMLERGREYVLKAWVKGSAPTGQKIVTQIMEMKNDGSYHDGSGQQVTDITDQWKLVELKYTPSAKAVFDYNWVYFYAIQGTDHLWIDDVTLMEASAQPQNEAEQQTLDNPAADQALSGEIVTPAQRVQIVLGTPDSVNGLGSQFADDMEYLRQSDGFAIRRDGSRIYIIGTESKGVLNGVYDFLEKNAGVLWTRSRTTDIGTLYDLLPTISADKVNYREKSPFQIRGFNLTGFGANGEYHEDPGTEAMIAGNKMNAKLAEFANQSLWDRHEKVGVKAVTLGHNLGYWLPNDEYFQDHPDYYNTDVSGQNYIPVADDTQINFYHPDVPGVIAGRVQQFLSQTPIEYVGIGINDTHYFQQGELSRSPFVTADHIVIQPDEPDYKSTVFYSFLNKIAAKVKVTNPKAKIVTFAYFFTDTPPRVKLEDNIIVVLAPLTGDDRVPLNTNDTGSSNFGHRLKLEGWLQNTKNIMMYNYYGSFLSDTYERPIAAKVQADMKYYRDLGITGVLPESIMDARTANWSINALQFWLFQKLMWNPDADIEQLKSDYIRKAYGAAAASMRTYYDLIEEGWNKYKDPIGYNTSTNTYIGKYIIEAGIKDAAQDALNQAWALADDKAKARIEPIKTTFEKMVLEVSEIPYLEAHASKTSASKAEIVGGVTDFSQGPWANAQALSQFYVMNTKDPAPVLTKVRLLWDAENLYVGYENFDDAPSEIVASDTAPGEWWASGADDDNETFITGHPAAASYYGFFNNSKALKVEYSGPVVDSGYNGQWEAYTSVGTDRWNSVQVIPFSSIQVDPGLTDTLQGYFFRTYHGLAGFYGWGVGAVWSSSSFHPIKLDDH
ncbi:hypothetical protein GCM10010911_15100 [Paenibacillus nasutitermitis]|uniref:SLH domain-containing protein n=2 Tax=Paenibacillus nasutitermitis TaxID=1652958 RepID=A0A916YRI5_9BACL|nr:hypothetical protein GCM10010911_15100 [Paenibacillus nasutitermitis]